MTSNPNINGSVIEHDYDLPYFSYMVAKANTRRIKKVRKGEIKPELIGLFLFDPREKKLELNWCA